MQTCGNTSLSLRFSSDFLVSTKGKVIFAAAVFVIDLLSSLKPAWCSNFSKLSVLSKYICTSSCLKQFWESVFSPLVLFWTLIIFKLWLICRKCPKNGYYVVYEKKSISASRSVENVSDKRLRIEVKPAQTNGIERVKHFVNVYLHCIVRNLWRISKIWTLPHPGKNVQGMHWFRSNSWVIKRGAVWFNSFKSLKNAKCQSYRFPWPIYTKRSSLIKKLYNFDAWWTA